MVTFPTLDSVALQSEEFRALEELERQDRRLRMTAVVDDDYPEVRHAYEGALRAFLHACKANGRSME